MALSTQTAMEYVYLHLGGEDSLGVYRPQVEALIPLALSDYAKFLIDQNPETAKKFITSVTNQTWTNSQFSAPADMLFYNQKGVIRLDIAGTLAFQLEDRDRLEMIGGLLNTYYALEGKTLFIKHPSLTSGSNLNMRYYKIPAITDIDDEMTPMFLEVLIDRVLKLKYGTNTEQTDK